MDKRLCAAVAIGVLAVGTGWSGEAWGAGCAPSGTSLALTAENHAFDTDCLAVPAGEAFTIRFENRDSDRHNVAVLPSHTSTDTLFQGDIVPGPKNLVYAVHALKAGTYHFHCEIHPNLMNGTFVVAAAASSPATSAKPSTTPSPTMSMGQDTPAAAPAQTPKPAAAPRTSASAPSVAGGTTASATAAPRTAAAPGNPLPRTGPGSARLLLVLAGLALAVGGISVVGGTRRSSEG
jgi:plastocyanin